MTLGVALRERIASALGSEVVRASRVRGGDVADAHRMALADGREVFVKSCSDQTASASPGMFPAEARGLAWLAEADAVFVPQPVAVEEAFLVLPFIEVGPPARDHDELLGRGLAALHRKGAPSFGFEQDNYLATLPQSNAPHPIWSELYGEGRMRPLLARAVDASLLSHATAQLVDQVIAKLPSLVGPDEPPARLHGDLWGGNAMVDETGAPVLVDPAVYGGHREMDLAMMRLFGGFSSRVFAAYHEAFPLAPGHEERVELHQLYPLLAHVCLFGGSYAASVQAAAQRYA